MYIKDDKAPYVRPNLEANMAGLKRQVGRRGGGGGVPGVRSAGGAVAGVGVGVVACARLPACLPACLLSRLPTCLSITVCLAAILLQYAKATMMPALPCACAFPSLCLCLPFPCLCPPFPVPVPSLPCACACPSLCLCLSQCEQGLNGGDSLAAFRHLLLLVMLQDASAIAIDVGTANRVGFGGGGRAAGAQEA